MNSRTLAIGLGGAVIVGGAVALAVPALAGSSPSPSASPTRSVAPADPSHRPHPRWTGRDRRPGDRKPGERRGLHRNAVHGETTLRGRDGTFRTLAWQRGDVTARTATTLTVRSADGTVWTWTTGPKTRTHKRSGAIAVGDTVRVGGQRSGSARTATSVRETR